MLKFVDFKGLSQLQYDQRDYNFFIGFSHSCSFHNGASLEDIPQINSSATNHYYCPIVWRHTGDDFSLMDQPCVLVILISNSFSRRRVVSRGAVQWWWVLSWNISLLLYSLCSQSLKRQIWICDQLCYWGSLPERLVILQSLLPSHEKVMCTYLTNPPSPAFR